ncbi:MAG: acyl carrier protein [Ruminococcus sp.]|nr:acyl carrier protein [Ruminococcus sp.]
MLEKMKELICNYVDVDPETITEDSRFIEDLGFNSFDFMSLLGELENELGITVDEQEVVNIHTVGEAVKYTESRKA